MATQGLVTVLSDGRVVMKVVAGCNGYNAEKLAERLRNSWPVNIDQAYKTAEEVGFGAPDCRVVLTEDRERYDGKDDLDPRYRATFPRPEFNPRWEHGTADHVIVINV